MYYREDLRETIAGRGTAPSFFVYSLIPGLPAESMTGAMMRAKHDNGEWTEYFGLSREWYLLADLYDATTQQIRVSGNWKKGKAPEFDAYPRPGRDGKGKKVKKKKGPKTLRDLFGELGGQNATPVADGGNLWLAPP